MPFFGDTKIFFPKWGNKLLTVMLSLKICLGKIVVLRFPPDSAKINFFIGSSDDNKAKKKFQARTQYMKIHFVTLDPDFPFDFIII